METLKKMSTTADQLSDEELHAICDEIFARKNVLGVLPVNSRLKLFATMADVSIQTAEEIVLNEAGDRFQEMVVLLMSECPYKFLNYGASKYNDLKE